jgi:EPS-associated MarR family transcriptional regulator
MNDSIHLNVLKIVEGYPKITQRELAITLGVSLGKANYCLKSLIEKGWLKASNFKNNKNKKAYMYLMTPRGIDEKARMTIYFLARKIKDYEVLEHEIQKLKHEVADNYQEFYD